MGPEWTTELNRKAGKEKAGLAVVGSGSDEVEDEKQRESEGPHGEENEKGGRGGLCAEEAAQQGSYGAFSH